MLGATRLSGQRPGSGDGRTVREGKGMRPSRGDDSNLGVRRRGLRDRDDRRQVDARRGDEDRGRAAAGAEARTGVLAVMIGGSAVIVRGVFRVFGHLRRDGVVAVLGAMVEAARVEQGGLEPDGPNGGKRAEPRGAKHDMQTIGGVGDRPIEWVQTARHRGHLAVCRP